MRATPTGASYRSNVRFSRGTKTGEKTELRAQCGPAARQRGAGTGLPDFVPSQGIAAVAPPSGPALYSEGGGCLSIHRVKRLREVTGRGVADAMGDMFDRIGIIAQVKTRPLKPQPGEIAGRTLSETLTELGGEV